MKFRRNHPLFDLGSISHMVLWTDSILFRQEIWCCSICCTPLFNLWDPHSMYYSSNIVAIRRFILTLHQSERRTTQQSHYQISRMCLGKFNVYSSIEGCNVSKNFFVIVYFSHRGHGRYSKHCCTAFTPFRLGNNWKLSEMGHENSHVMSVFEAPWIMNDCTKIILYLNRNIIFN